LKKKTVASRKSNVQTEYSSSGRKFLLYARLKTQKMAIQVLVTLAYNLIYTGDRDQEDCNSKPAQANSL
jgi:hypothetical protein